MPCPASRFPLFVTTLTRRAQLRLPYTFSERLKNTQTLWFSDSAGNTASASKATVSTIRRASQCGQKPQVLVASADHRQTVPQIFTPWRPANPKPPHAQEPSDTAPGKHQPA